MLAVCGTILLHLLKLEITGTTSLPSCFFTDLELYLLCIAQLHECLSLVSLLQLTSVSFPLLDPRSDLAELVNAAEVNKWIPKVK